MPLSPFQIKISKLLSENRTPESYLAGGAALHFAPNSLRYSLDLDYFHDSESRIASAYRADHLTLVDAGYEVEPDITQPGYIRAVVCKGNEATKVEWARDSTWRFMPVIRNEEFGYQLHPIDLATNKVLALAGRDEPRDLVDTLYLHQHVLGLGPLVWAAVGKDPGFSPLSLLELIRRRGKIRPEDLMRLHLTEPLDIRQLKTEWLSALQAAETFITSRPPGEVGCLYFASSLGRFIDPSQVDKVALVPHYGRPGGVLPQIFG